MVRTSKQEHSRNKYPERIERGGGTRKRFTGFKEEEIKQTNSVWTENRDHSERLKTTLKVRKKKS